MPRQETDLNPVSHITIDAIGKPGQRVFYIQAFQGDTPTTFIVEKIQVQTLVIGIMQFLEEIRSPTPGSTRGGWRLRRRPDAHYTPGRSAFPRRRTGPGL